MHGGAVAGQYATLAAAVAASHDGDSVLLPAGTYRNAFADIHTRITIAGVGGMARLVADRFPDDGRAILRSTVSVTFENLDISGATDPGRNGAAILHVGGDLTIADCIIHDNQDGLLSGPDVSAIGTITITHSEFFANGTGTGYTHNIYVGRNDPAFPNRPLRLVITHSLIHGAVVGHEVKSRADVTIIRDSVIESGFDGTDSYAIDLPNGGIGVIADNVLEKGVGSENRAFIHFGGEGHLHDTAILSVTGNAVTSDDPEPALLVANAIPGAAITVSGNVLHGMNGLIDPADEP
jgi:hypothetical protein